MSIIRASVAIPRPIRRLFTYSVPPGLLPRCRRGVRVMVPFGRRRLTGYLLEVSEQAGEGTDAVPGIPLRPIEEVLDPDPILDETMLELTRWAADYYLASWGEVIRAALPGMQAVLRRIVALTPAGARVLAAPTESPGGAARPENARAARARAVLAAVADLAAEGGPAVGLADLKERLGSGCRPELLRRLDRGGLIQVAEVPLRPGPRPRLEERVRLLPRPASGAGDRRQAGARAARQRAVLDLLASSGGEMAAATLLERTGAARPTLRALRERGWVAVERREVPRRPAALELPAVPAASPEPNADQRGAIAAIREALDTRRFATCLVQGVTGSGKTEVYLRSIETAVAQGRRALYLVPEIGLTPLLARRMRARFGEVLALLHSGLSEGERYDEWRRIREGKAEVVLGARSAVFAPLRNLGLIVVDEEHDASYKQGESPRYNGRDLAILRGKMDAATVVLGSATPSMESYLHATRGKYRLLRLPVRVGTAGLPAIETVDMRREFEEVGRETVLSRRLLEALRIRLGRGEQSLVLLNRRGFSTFVLCRACGEQVNCRRCSIAMTLHLRERRLRCHYCSLVRGVPTSCPRCGSAHLHFGGTGTERLEETLRATFPSARIARMDRDSTGGRGSVEALLTRVERGEIDVLVGTQMIAKGHDFPNVTLVGVLSADALLGLPDFRAAERTYQLLTQVAGRSGRADREGEVIVQAYDAEHHAIRAACRHDFDAFAEKELAYRRVMGYPPYTALALVLVKDRRLERAREEAAAVAGALRRSGSSSLQILGPAPAPLERLRGEYRMQVIVKAGRRRALQQALSEALADLDRRGARVEDLAIDVDPIATL